MNALVKRKTPQCTQQSPPPIHPFCPETPLYSSAPERGLPFSALLPSQPNARHPMYTLWHPASRSLRRPRPGDDTRDAKRQNVEDENNKYSTKGTVQRTDKCRRSHIINTSKKRTRSIESVAPGENNETMAPGKMLSEFDASSVMDGRGIDFVKTSDMEEHMNHPTF